jgi:hypothetical protein
MRSLLIFALVPTILAATAPAHAVVVVGNFTADVIAINGDETLAPPEFTDETTLTGRFGYDTSAATDSDPDPSRGT